MLATARVHSPLFTLRGGTNEVLRGVVAKSGERQPRQPRDEAQVSWSTTIGRRSFDARLGRRGLPDAFDGDLWRTLEETGLTRLTSAQGATPRESAVVLEGLARWAAAVPLAETDLLAAWLAEQADLTVPDDGPLTVAIAGARPVGGQARRHCHRRAVAADRGRFCWPCAATTPRSSASSTAPRSTIRTPWPVNRAARSPSTCRWPTPCELSTARRRRAGPARRVGAVRADPRRVLGGRRPHRGAHRRTRPSSAARSNKFQAVQHALAGMLGEIERSRAATALATAAVADHGFDSARADYAVTVAKVAVGRAVGPVTTIAHQLHGAIGVTIEHPLWLATMRARSWADELRHHGPSREKAWADGALGRRPVGSGRRRPRLGVRHGGRTLRCASTERKIAARSSLRTAHSNNRGAAAATTTIARGAPGETRTSARSFSMASTTASATRSTGRDPNVSAWSRRTRSSCSRASPPPR